MSEFSVDVKNELALGSPEKECCQKALLTAILLGQARLESASPGVPVCVLETWSAASVRLLLRLIRRINSPPVTWEARRLARFREGVCYMVRLGPAPRLARFLGSLGFILPPAGSGPLGYEYASLKRRCCKRAFLRGAFLSGGSVNDPGRGYHMEWVVREPEAARVLSALTSDLDLSCHQRDRASRTVLYLKASNPIALALNLMGAHTSLLRFEEFRAVKETKNQVHRRVNCDTANLERSSRTAGRQVAVVEYLREKVGLGRLPDDLRAVARARLRLPHASYSELGRRLDPPATKVAVGRRLGRLEKMASGLGYDSLMDSHVDSPVERAARD